MVSNSLNTLVEIMKNVQEGVELLSGVFFCKQFSCHCELVIEDTDLSACSRSTLDQLCDLE